MKKLLAYSSTLCLEIVRLNNDFSQGRALDFSSGGKSMREELEKTHIPGMSL